MRLPTYPDYKDSGVRWLGKVPTSWDVKALKHAFSIVGGSTPKSDNEDFWDGDVVWVTPADLSGLNGLSIEDSGRRITALGLESCGTRLVPPGSVVLSTRAPIGSLAIAGSTLCTNQGCKSLVAKSPLASRFFAYMLSVASEELNLRGRGTTFLELSGDSLGSFEVAFPSLPEQSAITAFLDRETAKIDGLIAEQKRLLELLAEKRQAVISCAVTKGLNPDAPMRGSGVAWLGEVPAHWRVGKAGFYVSILPGFAFSSSAFSEEITDVRLLRGINVGVGEIRWEDVVYWRRESDDGLEPFELQDGDVVIGMDRPVISGGVRVSVITPRDLPCLLLQRVAKIQPGEQMRGRFIARMLSSHAFGPHFLPETTGVSVPHISGDQIAAFVVPVPPVEEQDAICNFIDAALVEIDALFDEAKKGVALLLERRSALIAAAVTGQIDVREAA